MAYLKPQSPIKNGEDHVYPLTTYDQIIMSDGSRWDGVVSDVTAVSAVNGQTGNVTLKASDVGAAAASHSHDSLVDAGTNSYAGYYDDPEYGIGIEIGYNATNGNVFDLYRSGPGEKIKLYDEVGNQSGTIYTTGNLTFSLSGTTLTITKS